MPVNQPSIPQFRRVQVTADAVVSATPTTLWGVAVYAAHADWRIELTDAGDSTGTNVLELGGEAEGGQTYFDFTGVGGIEFPNVGIFADVTITGAIMTFWVS